MVSSWTLFCYISVQVTVVPYYDAQYSYSHPLYHVESKPCTQGKLPLTFCFHQPGTVCVIRLSIHSIVDSEGVEYMYHSEGCTCVVQITDRDQHGEVKMRDRHGVVRIKEPPLLMYTPWQLNSATRLHGTLRYCTHLTTMRKLRN